MKVIIVPKDTVTIEKPTGDEDWTFSDFIRGLLKLNPDFGKQPGMYNGYKIQDILETYEGEDPRDQEIRFEDQEYKMMKKSLKDGGNPAIMQLCRPFVEAFDNAKTEKKRPRTITPPQDPGKIPPST